MRRRVRMFLPMAVLIMVGVASSCGVGASSADPGATRSPSLAQPSNYVVATGDAGVALVGDTWLEPVPELQAPALSAGPVMAQVDADSAAVVANGLLAVLRPHAPAVVVACADCAGVAATPTRIVTTRRNFTPDQGFEIVTVNHALGAERFVAAHRLPERADAQSPNENVESPITLAADDNAVTVGYLGRNGGVRAGPSVIAQYDYTGRLRRSLFVDGVIGRTVSAPDGRHLGIDVSGSSGACITESRPAVLDLATFALHLASPAVPAGVRANDPLLPPWFEGEDMVWDNEELVATGRVMAPPAESPAGCDPAPIGFERRIDPASGIVRDLRRPAPAARRVGAGCGTSITIEIVAPGFAPDGTPGDVGGGRELVRHIGNDTVVLGAYQYLGQGPPATTAC